MKNVCYVYGNLPAYRKEFFSKLSESLKEIDVDFSIMYGTPIGKKVVRQDENGNYRKIPFESKATRLGLFTLVHIPGLLKTFKKEKPDAVVISFSSTQISMLKLVLYCLIHKIPYASWRCGYNREDYNKLSARTRNSIISFVERKARYCIAYGSYYRQILINKGIDDRKIIIAQNTIDVESIISKNKDIDRRYDDEETKVLFVGALIKKKYLETSIEAIRQLRLEGYKVKFDIVGGGEMEEPLRQLAETSGLGGIVNVVGPKYGDEVRHYFRSHHVFLAAGLGGLAINEAMAYGLPIISTNADWTICDLIDGNGYFMQEYGDVDLQVRCLKNFLELPPSEKLAMSKKSVQIIQERASLANMVAKHMNVCVNMLNNGIY